MKSRQLGLSEMGVGEMLHFADTYSAFSPKCLYTFPTDRAMKEFVQTRLDPILDNTPYFRGIVNKDKNSQKVKQIRNSTMFFRTSSTSRTVEGVDIDYLSLDEYDRVLDAAESSALEAMSSSKFGIVRRWSTPRAPETGIDRLFKKSDQHYYLHKCEHCNYWNQMNFEEYDSSSVEAGGNVLCVNPSGVDRLTGNVVDGSFQYVCQKCGKPLDRWYSGEWVAKFPDRTADGGGIRGYFISQMNAVWISADNLKRKELSTPSKQSFHNYVLGMPFADKSLMVVDDDVLENRSEDLPTQRHNRDGYRFISVGIDWGRTHWITVHGMRDNGKIELIRLFSVQEPKTPKDIGVDLQRIIVEISKYRPDIIIADTGDNGDKVLRLINHFGKGKVFGCTYNSSPKSTGDIYPRFNEKGDGVKVDKLMQNKMYIDALKSQEISVYNIIDNDLKLYLEHWKNVVITDEEEEDGGFNQVISRRGDDHYAQASVYAYIGLKRLRDNMRNNGTPLETTYISTQEPSSNSISQLYGR